MIGDVMMAMKVRETDCESVRTCRAACVCVCVCERASDGKTLRF